MCVFWTVIGLLCLLVSVCTWAAFRAAVLSREFNYPEIIEDVPHDER